MADSANYMAVGASPTRIFRRETWRGLVFGCGELNASSEEGDRGALPLRRRWRQLGSVDGAIEEREEAVDAEQPFAGDADLAACRLDKGRALEGGERLGEAPPDIDGELLLERREVDSPELELQDDLAYQLLLGAECVGAPQRQLTAAVRAEVTGERGDVLLVDPVEIREGRRAQPDQVGSLVQEVLIEERLSLGVPNGGIGATECVAALFEAGEGEAQTAPLGGPIGKVGRLAAIQVAKERRVVGNLELIEGKTLRIESQGSLEAREETLVAFSQQADDEIEIEDSGSRPAGSTPPRG